MNREEKAVELAVHATNHQITIAAALLAGIVGFADKLKDQSTLSAFWEHKLWVVLPLLGAILSGIFLLLGLGGALAADRQPFKGIIVRLLGITQTLTFGAAVISTVILLGFVRPTQSETTKSSQGPSPVPTIVSPTKTTPP